MRPYLQYARCAFQRRAAYRLANWSGIAVNFFFFLIHAQVFIAFFGSRSEVGGWRPEDAVLYFACSEALMMALAVFPPWSDNVGERVRTGEVVSDLARPVSLLLRDLGETCGRGLYYLMFRTPVLLLAFWGVYRIVPPLRIELVLLPVSLLLAAAVISMLWYTASATAFWTERATGTMHAVLWAHTIFGGVFVPLDFYPDWLRLLSDVLPFRAALYTPVALLAGTLGGPALAFGLAHQVFWVAVLGWLASTVGRRGVRQLVAHGG